MKEKAMIIGAAVERGAVYNSSEMTRAELEKLIETAGAQACCEVIQQRPAPDPATYIGEGKAAYAKELAKANEADFAVFDGELSPSQIQNLEKAIGIRVIDRSMLILDIFALHAASKEGKLQVELAQMNYTMPRLSGKGIELSRLGGGVGTRGPGETKLETDRRRLRRRIAALKTELAEVAKNRDVQRKARDASGVLKIAIVGYTNAGKSTLLNFLTGADVLEEDKLFATLDPTTRKITFKDGTRALITDTIGFIKNLPHHLIEAFASTLDELCSADILLHVVDASDPDCDKQIEVVEQLVAQLGAGAIPCVKVFNKADAVAEKPFLSDAVYISAKTGFGVGRLEERIIGEIKKLRATRSFFVPYGKGAVIEYAHSAATVLEETYEKDGIRLKLSASEEVTGRISEMLQ